jgi:hypothetical protein
MSDFTLIDNLSTQETLWFWVSITSLLVLALAEVLSHYNARTKESFIALNQESLDKPSIQSDVRNFAVWEDRWFWVSIASLVMLGLSEVISHRYTVQKDEAVSQLKDNLDNDQEHEIGDLKLKLATSQKEILQLRINLKQAELKFLEANKEAALAKKEADEAKNAVAVGVNSKKTR